MKRMSGQSECCLQIRGLQRQRRSAVALRCMLERQCASVAAGAISRQLSPKPITVKAALAAGLALMKSIDAGNVAPKWRIAASEVDSLIDLTAEARQNLRGFERQISKDIVAAVGALPIAEWIKSTEQRGAGLLLAGTIVGESGDLANYPHYRCLYKRLGLAPINGKMPSTWRRSGGLCAKDWIEIGYSPERRSVAFQIGECLVKQNRAGPYRTHYLAVKEKAKAAHADWSPKHVDNHAKLLMTKLFIANLWRAWRDLSGGQ